VSNPSPEGRPYLIIGRESINRAVHGDVVAIEILPESEWRGTTDTIIEERDVTSVENADTDEENNQIENEVDAREHDILKSNTTRGQSLQVTAKVVGIIKRNWRTYSSSQKQLRIGT